MENQSDQLFEEIKTHAERTRRLVTELKAYNDQTCELLTKVRIHVSGGEIPEGGVFPSMPRGEAAWKKAGDAFSDGLMYLTRSLEEVRNG